MSSPSSSSRWIRALQTVIDGIDAAGEERLTVAAERARRSRSELRNPATVESTAVPHGAVVGVLWAMEDHPTLVEESVAAITASVFAKGGASAAPWAVLDAVFKYSGDTKSTGGGVPAIRAALVERLPQLLYSCLPQLLMGAAAGGGGGKQYAGGTETLFGANAAGGVVGEAEEVALLSANRAAVSLAVLDTLRSWHDPATLPANPIGLSVRRAVDVAGTRLRYELHVAATTGGGSGKALVHDGGASTTNASSSSMTAGLSADQARIKSELASSIPSGGMVKTSESSGGLGGPTLDVLTKEAIAKVLEAIAPAAPPPPPTPTKRSGGAVVPQPGTGGGGRGRGGMANTAQLMARSLSSMDGSRLAHHISELFRIPRGSAVCDVCGTYFDSGKAKEAHARLHYYWRSVDEAMHVRLPPLTESQLVRYTPNHSDGSFVRSVSKLNEVSTKTSGNWSSRRHIEGKQ